MVNNYKPYDPNDDSERSSGASYVPTRREIKEKREELEEQRIVQESFDTSQPFVKPIEQERLEQQIRDQEVQLRNQESSAQLQADYLKTFATENAKAIESYKVEVDQKYDEIQKWIDGFTPEEYGMAQGEYQKNVDSKIKEFTDIQEKYNQSVKEYNDSYDTFKSDFDRTFQGDDFILLDSEGEIASGEGKPDVAFISYELMFKSLRSEEFFHK